MGIASIALHPAALMHSMRTGVNNGNPGIVPPWLREVPPAKHVVDPGAEFVPLPGPVDDAAGMFTPLPVADVRDAIYVPHVERGGSPFIPLPGPREPLPSN